MCFCVEHGDIPFILVFSGLAEVGEELVGEVLDREIDFFA